MKTNIPSDELAQIIAKAQERSLSMAVNPLSPKTMLGASLMPYLRFSSVVGITIDKLANGRWNADIELANVPAGIANILGTPESLPAKTRADAAETLIAILAAAIANEREQVAPTTSPKSVYFYLDDISLEFEASSVKAESAVSNTNLTPEDIDEIFISARSEFNQGRPFTAANFSAIPEKSRKIIVGLCIFALSNGIVRWPRSKPISASTLH